MIDEKKLEQFKKKLEEERKRLIKELEELQTPEDFGEDVGDVDEEVDEAEEFSIKIAESQTVRQRINEIDYLINKINSRTYGFCDKCEKEISKEELLKDPELILCSACRSKKNKSKK
jgi:DnaK suppressor protein